MPGHLTNANSIKRKAVAIKITAIYVLAGGLWILFGNHLLAMLFSDAITTSGLQTLKGLFFILATGCLLFFLARKEVIAFQEKEAALRASEKKYHELADSLPQIIFEADDKGNLTFANKNAFDLFGYDRQDLDQGLNALEMISPKDRERALANILKILQGEELQDREYAAQKRDGGTFPVAIHSNRIMDGDKPVGLRGIIFDLTELKIAEKALKESKEKYRILYEESKKAEEVYRSLFHTSADAIVLYDLEGKVNYINPAFSQIFGWTLEELEGKQLPFVPDSEKEATMASVGVIMGKGEAIQGLETKRYTKGGSLIEVNVSASRFHDHEGAPAGMLSILRDTSEKKQIEAQLQEAQRMEAIGTLAGGIAHNFNNLLMGIQGNASLVQNLVRSGSKLTNQLLGYAMGGRYEVKPIDLNRLVNDTAETFSATKREYRVSLELDHDLSMIKADSSQLEQVLMNLYVNAADAMPGGGDLFLETSNTTHETMRTKPFKIKPGAYVLLTVRDTGIGMDKATTDRIFEPFFTTKGLERGTGLGLASAYGIVKSHGGYIDVQSEKGQGTVFEIYFPASTEIALEESVWDGEIAEGHGTVMMVDDEEMVLEVGEAILEKLGYDVFPANSGKEALEIYRAHRDDIDIVVLDMIMPDMGGGETFDKLREMNPQVKVLLASGYSVDGQAGEILKRGCDGFIQKPFEMDHFSNKLREILDR
ncbi:MAG: PAS domain S-box protein [Deltaproteobacteria bacterium]|nr:PAS domain S-box protein [Deltaproteobacteria bacterium]